MNQQHKKYLALRKVRTCPQILKEKGLPAERDAVLLIVGSHWCLTVDRDYTSTLQHYELIQQQLKLQEKQRDDSRDKLQPPTSPLGGGAAFIDNLLFESSGSNAYSDNNNNNIHYNIRRRIAEDYLSLEGSYGVVTLAGEHGLTRSELNIARSTLPWLEGSELLQRHNIQLQYNDVGELQSVIWESPSSLPPSTPWNKTSNLNNTEPHRCLGEWEVLECSFSRSELEAMFNINGDINFNRELMARL